MKALTITLLTLFALSSIILNVEGCSPPNYDSGYTPPTVVQKIMPHEELIMIKVRRLIKTDEERSRRRYLSTEYTAEVDVLCILRGKNRPAVLNVTHAGYSPVIDYSPGLCYGAEVEAGQKYIMGLQDRSRAGTPVIPSEDFIEALNACGLKTRPNYPRGVSKSTASYKCPAGKPAGECRST